MQIDLHKNNQGIGIVEIVISVSVLAVGILGLLRAFPHGISIQHDLDLSAAAHQIAESKIEEYATANYYDISVGILEDQAHVDPIPSGRFYDFLRTVEVSLLDEDLIPTGADIGLKKIKVTVYWPRPFGDALGSVSLVTLISER